MPAARSKKGKKAKAAAGPEPASEPVLQPEPEVQQTTVDDNAMQTDQPELSSSISLVETAVNIMASAETAVVNAAEVAVETVEDIVEAASEFVEETTMGRTEEDSRSTGQSGNSTPGDPEEATSKVTMEQRQAKLNELRRKMVR